MNRMHETKMNSHQNNNQSIPIDPIQTNVCSWKQTRTSARFVNRLNGRKFVLKRNHQLKHQYRNQQHKFKQHLNASAPLLIPILISLFLIPLLQTLLSSSSSSKSSYQFVQNPIQFAEAAHQHQHAQHQESISAATTTNQQQAETIIQLSSTNFNSQLIQYKSPFQHILLIQYYLPFSRFCAKFKPTYQKLSKRVYQWRNVIRLAQIDLANSNNSPIAHSWQIDSVPTLRVHPPVLDSKRGQMLNEKYLEFNATMKQTELQKSMFGHYKEQQLFVETLNVTRFMDKWQMLRRHLVTYVRKFVSKMEQQNKNVSSDSSSELLQLPDSWPNLHTVTETTLSQLLQNHPRRELFLLIERKPAILTTTTSATITTPSSTSSSTHNNVNEESDDNYQNSALQVMLDLSSTSARKAIRYFRAEENLPLFMDILTQLNKTSTTNYISTSKDENNQNLNFSTKNEAFWDNENLVLIYIDDAHPAIKQGQSELASGFHSAINKLTSKDLEMMEGSFVQNGTTSLDMSLPSAAAMQQSRENINGSKSKRSPTKSNRVSRSTSTASTTLEDNSERSIELLVNFINHINIDTSEDRTFIDELAKFDEHYASSKKTSNNDQHQHQSDKIIASSSSSNNNLNQQQLNRLTNAASIESEGVPVDNSISSDKQMQQSASASPYKITQNGHDTTTAPNALNNINNLNHNHHPSSITVIGDQYMPRSSSDDYGDKLKAIEYIFQREIVWPGKWNNKPNGIEQNLQRLRILIDLISSIKTWFPLPNASSRQFLDGIERFLSKEEARLQSSSQADDGASSQLATMKFDTRELKHEIDRLRAEGKKFPSVESYNVCKTSGYSCALWRLFHTLTAFEYQTLTQVRQQQQQQADSNNYLQPNAASLTSSPSPVDLAENSAARSEQRANAGTESNNKLESEIVTGPTSYSSSQSPIGRLISPPKSNEASSLSLTILTSNENNNNNNNNVTSRTIGSIINNNNGKIIFSELDLPTPVLLVMKDYVTTFFSCAECGKNFETETSDINLDRIRREKPEFSILQLWRIHNLVNRRLAVTSEKNPPNNPKIWYPSYYQCKSCYNEVPSYIIPGTTSPDDRVDPEIMFSEPIQWNTTNILHFMEHEYTRNPLIRNVNMFGCNPWSLYIILALTIISFVIMTKTCCSLIERQRRHKSNLLNANGARYSVELQ